MLGANTIPIRIRISIIIFIRRAAAAARSPSVSNGASPLLSNDCFNLSTSLALPLIRKRPSCTKPPEFSIENYFIVGVCLDCTRINDDDDDVSD
ncbi:hypothetical protein DERP_009287 [Dermatophagoides pteronyssinus]|uniref:Secreted protein n=1 Tax=Dermatophagoides pteronyssinus TaxID=6956 RepID=A0ABQ8ITD7_DERPT|nr:hypothetical protein DERP_009287 [Dermatophagoides pteronyssinus]